MRTLTILSQFVKQYPTLEDFLAANTSGPREKPKSPQFDEPSDGDLTVDDDDFDVDAPARPYVNEENGQTLEEEDCD